jgi:hypothetical protein
MNFTGTYPTSEEVERIRLLMSTYQDGTGQLTLKGKEGTLPNWRDFERSTAIAFKGIAYEAKSFFDVFVPIGNASDTYFGISCKMRGELRSAQKKGVLYVEVSNAAGDFWETVRNVGVETGADMVKRPGDAGQAILDLVSSWHEKTPYKTDLSKSYYLILQYDPKKLDYQHFILPLEMPDAQSLNWSVRVGKKKKGGLTHCLIGADKSRSIIEWYADSGGQLKYYPPVSAAIWKSDLFRLESLPDVEEGYSILNKAKAYFPESWGKVDS